MLFRSLSEISGLDVCNLTGDISDTYRVARHPISSDLRKEFFHKALQQ